MQLLLQWKNNKYLHIVSGVCGLRYTTCNAHAPYSSADCSFIPYFSTLSHNRMIFDKKI